MSSPQEEYKDQKGYYDNEHTVDKLPKFTGGEAVLSEDVAAFAQLVDAEQTHDIKLRSMSWQKCMFLLFGDQVCLAIMAQAWSFMVLGWVPALITTFLAGIIFYITSLTMWKYLMKNPHIKDVCDLGASLFGGSKAAYIFTAFMLLANNILLIGFHVLTGAKVLNTLSDHSQCTVVFGVISMLLGILMSLPRTLKHVSYMSMFSAACMGIAIILFLVFVGIEDHPVQGYGKPWPEEGLVHTTAFPIAGVTWVDCLNAVLNITFLWVPQILFPTFIAEMEKPQDFPKALTGLAAMSFVLFIVVPIVGYRYLGQYAVAPAFGALETVYKKASFSFVIVPTLVIGVIYCNVSAKFIYSNIMRGSHHEHSHTVKGWATWVAVVSGIWALAFIFGEIIPSMGDFLSLLGAVFDSFFGFLYWSIAHYLLYRHTGLFKTASRSINTIFHIFVFIIGLALLGPGTYAAVMAIKADYSGSTRPAFSCKNIAI